jgi:Flp pilus assembly pilin Flp
MSRIRGRLESVVVLLLDDTGQDLIEYALLASIFTAAGLLAIQNIQGKMGGLFNNWGSMLASGGTLWVPPDPQ